MAGIVVVATGTALFAQDLSPRGSEQDGAHPASGYPAERPRGVGGTGARSAESEISRTPAPANRENSGESLVGDGKGVAGYTARDADDREAVRFRKAAAERDAAAQFNLALMADGRGVPQNDREAVQWYRKAAEQGEAIAQFNLGLKYADGEGVPKDDVQAYAWANLAGAQGHESAREFRADLSANMTRAQIAEAQKLSRELAD